jgi:hypothetical protein
LTHDDLDLLRENLLWHRIVKIYGNHIKSEEREITDELTELITRELEGAVLDVQNLSDLEVIRETEEFWADHPTGTLRWQLQTQREIVNGGDKSEWIRRLAGCWNPLMRYVVEVAFKLREEMNKGR